MQLQSGTKPTAKHTPHKAQPITAADNPDAQLKGETVAALTGRGKSTLYAMVRAGKFPAPNKHGLRCTRRRAGDVTAWLKAQASS